jgi:hypothetical protein
MAVIGVIYKTLPFLFLLLWPLSLLSVFILDDPTVTGFADFLRHYAVFSSFLYPLYLLVTWGLTRLAVRKQMSASTLRFISVIPFLNGIPWLILLLIFLILRDVFV